ncbi:MAG: hypothetical protein R2789_19510 [Microthrixaceae bacterium]
MAVEALTHIDDVTHVVVADLSHRAAAEVVADLGSDKLQPAAVDVSDPASLTAVLEEPAWC